MSDFEAQAQQAADDLAVQFTTAAEQQLGLSREGLEKVMQHLSVVQSPSGVITTWSAPGVRSELGEGQPLVAPLLSDGSISQTDADAIADVLRSSLGESAFIQPAIPEPVTGESRLTDDGLHSIERRDDGDLFTAAPQRDVLIYDDADADVYQAAKAEAARRGSELKVVKRQPDPESVYRPGSGDLILTSDDHSEYVRLSKAAREQGRALFSANGDLLIHRKRDA